MKKWFSLLCALLLLLAAALPAFAEAQPFLTLAQPDLGVIGGYCVSGYVRSAEALEAILSAEKKPANAILFVDETLALTGEGGSFGTLADAVEKLTAACVMPTLYLRSEAAVKAACGWLSENGVEDVFVMSDDPALVQLARTTYPVCRGVLDLTAAFADKTSLTDEELLAARGKANACAASIVMLPANAASAAAVKYICDRLVSVWVSESAPCESKPGAMRIVAAGGHGCAVSDPAVIFDLFEKELTDDNILLRAPANIGHRGIPAAAPENTVEGSLLAYELGADVIELDVYVSRDGELVVMHDGSTGRTCDQNKSVTTSTAAQLKEIKVNKGFEKDERFADARVPTLRDYYEAFKGKDVQIFVEFKGSRKQVVEAFTTLTKECGMEGQVSVITYTESFLKNLRIKYPEMSRGLLCGNLTEGNSGASMIGAVLRHIQPLATTYNPDYGKHVKTFVKNANIRGTTTWCYTINSKGNYVKLFLDGYNGLTTNDCRFGADFPKILTDKTADSLLPGETLPLSAAVTKYDRSESDVSEKVRVIPLSGDFTFENGAFAATGDFSYALAYTYRIDGRQSYTLYTQPHTVCVDIPEPEIPNGGFPWGWIAGGCGGLLLLTGVLLLLTRRKKENK